MLFDRRGAKEENRVLPEPAICIAEGTSIQTTGKSIEMVKLKERAAALGWTVSNSSQTVGTALWQLLATHQPGAANHNQGSTLRVAQVLKHVEQSKLSN